MNREKVTAKDGFDHGTLGDAGAEAEKYDRSLVESWKVEMEGLLIFAALLSVILTAFLVDSYTSVNVGLLAQISHQLGTSEDGGTFDALSFPSLPAPQLSVISQVLWFTSLGFSITCAFVATFVQRWARESLHKDNNPVAIVREHVFSFLHYGSRGLRMQTVVKIVPLLLYASLLLFFCGLAAFLIPVNLAVDIIVATLVAIVAAMYCVVQFLEYSYQISFFGIFWRTVQYFQISRDERRSGHETGEPAATSDVEAPTPNVLETIPRTENSDERSESGHDEYENGEDIFTEQEKAMQMDADSPPSRPSTALKHSPSISSVHASEESASIGAVAINEAEQFALERQEMAAERARLEAERDAARNALIAEKDAQIQALRAQLETKIDREKQWRSPEDAEGRERERPVRADIDGGVTKGQLRDFAYLLQDQRDVCERMKTLMDARWDEKQERRQNKEFKWAELRDMVQKMHDDTEAVQVRAQDVRFADEGKPGVEKVIEEVTRQNAEQRELLVALSDSWRADSLRTHEETIAAVRSTAQEQVDFNVQGYLDEFSKALATEVRMLLGEVGKLREERRALQHELGYLLCMKSKYGPGGEFEPDWKPPPGAPGGPPLDPPAPPPPDLPQARPGWRTVAQRRGATARQRKTKKKDATVPLFDPRQQLRQWAVWQPDPSIVPTPPAHEPTLLVPDISSPGLFGPRSPRSSRFSSPHSPVQSWAPKQPAPKPAPSLNKDEDLSWANWQPNFNLVPTPPAPEDARHQVESWAARQLDPLTDPILALRPPPPEAPRPRAAWPSNSILLGEEPTGAGDPTVVATPPPREHTALPVVPEIPRAGI